jgi:hypothetical protein
MDSILENIAKAEILSLSDKSDPSNNYDCTNCFCDTCDCICNQSCDSTTPNCYSL